MKNYSLHVTIVILSDAHVETLENFWSILYAVLGFFHFLNRHVNIARTVMWIPAIKSIKDTVGFHLNKITIEFELLLKKHDVQKILIDIGADEMVGGGAYTSRVH